MRVSRLLSSPNSAPTPLANFDSTTAFVRAIGRYLRGEGFPRLGMLPRSVAAIMPAANRLPRSIKRRLYRRSGASEAVSPDALRGVDIETVRRWVVDRYPDRGYPAVVVGSANGAAVHLSALLGVPWLPQTFLIPVRRSLPPDAATADMEWGREPGRALLDANPDVQLHHMHDPNQDRLMVRELAYFRVKLRRLGAAYERFLAETLAPKGRVIILNCASDWLATRVSDRHVFQFGGYGDLPPEEYHRGSERISAFLRAQGATRTRWDPPEPDGHSPEAEWGFEPALRDDVVDVAADRGYRVNELSFDDPADLSDVVADLYRERYAKQGLDTDRLLVQNFTLLDPWWTLRTGSIPYWLPFNTNSAAETLETYLEGRSEPLEELYLMLFSNGIDTVGQAEIDRWKELLGSARTRGAFVGVDSAAYPLDFGTYVRYHSALSETVPARQPLLPPLSVDEFEAFLADRSRRSAVEWEEH